MAAYIYMHRDAAAVKRAANVVFVPLAAKVSHARSRADLVGT